MPCTVLSVAGGSAYTHRPFSFGEGSQSMALTSKQAAFLRAYLDKSADTYHNQTRSAIAAGSPPKSADRCGIQFMRVNEVHDAVKKADAEADAKVVAAQDEAAELAGLDTAEALRRADYLYQVGAAIKPHTDGEGNVVGYMLFDGRTAVQALKIICDRVGGFNKNNTLKVVGLRDKYKDMTVDEIRAQLQKRREENKCLQQPGRKPKKTA